MVRLCFVVALAATLAAASAARAHQLSCDKTVNGEHVLTLSSYPATLTFQVALHNEIATVPSTALTIADPLLTALGHSLKIAGTSTGPVTVPPSATLYGTSTVSVASEAECLRIAGLDGLADDQIDNVFTATWDDGLAECRAKVICLPGSSDGGTPDAGTPDAGTPDAGTPDAGTPDAGTPDAGTPDAGTPDAGTPDAGTPDAGTPNSGATRTMGFFKNHLVALQDCLNQGPINLGYTTVTTVADAEAFFQTKPSHYTNTVDKDRFLLARQTLVGICNVRLFGTTPTPPDLLARAVAALSGTNCSLLSSLEPQVDAYNNSGDAVAFPPGFVPGPATPNPPAGSPPPKTTLACTK